MTTVDLGCGGTKRGDIGVDIVGPPVTSADYVCNLGFERIPLEDNSIDRVVAYHFIEHVPDIVVYKDNVFDPKGKKFHKIQEKCITHRPQIFLFNEIYRILKGGGTFYCEVPIVTDGSGRVFQQAFQDPTHVSYWLPERLRYFSGDYYGHHDTYGHTSRFELTHLSTGCGNGWNWCMSFELKAIKNLPENHPYLLEYEQETR